MAISYTHTKKGPGRVHPAPRKLTEERKRAKFERHIRNKHGKRWMQTHGFMSLQYR